MVSKFGVVEKWKQKRKDGNISMLKNNKNTETTSFEILEKYRFEMRNIKIENQPFRISGVLHILTNRISDLLTNSRNTLYYDVQSEVGRYIIGDNDYIEQVLEILLKNSISLSTDSEVSLKISKSKNNVLVFEVINKKELMHKTILKEYISAERTLTSMSENLNAFVKAKKIAKAMRGSLEVKSSWISGTTYVFKIPYYEDKDNRSNQQELKNFLGGKQALFIGKDKYDTQRAQYIFKTFGIVINNMKLSDFENKKPDIKKYDMAILRSSDLSYAHLSFLKNIYQDRESNFKIIIVHELFESKDRIAFSKSIAHAELYNPTIIGDVEEILYQMFILQSHAVKGINNMEIFDPETFAIKGNNSSIQDSSENYKGAHIAIVEDSKADQRIMRNILNIEGIRLFCLNNGAAMIDLLEKEEIDMIFSDINMPVMDGLTMTKKIRQVRKWDHIPIISISSMAFEHEIKQMQAAGMNASISKPIVPGEVYRALKIFLVLTPKIQERRIKLYKSKLHYNKEILDVEKGLKEVESKLDYQELLLETMEILKDTTGSFAQMIYNQEYHALEEFSKSALVLYKNIHAPKMIKLFDELVHFVSSRQKTYLIDYIVIYQKNWRKLQTEIEVYLEGTRDCV